MSHKIKQYLQKMPNTKIKIAKVIATIVINSKKYRCGRIGEEFSFLYFSLNFRIDAIKSKKGENINDMYRRMTKALIILWSKKLFK
jgi:hypothetical protein